MKSRKFLALFLAIFMLASLVVPVSAEEITPDPVGIIGYNDALVDRLTPAEIAALKSIQDYPVEGVTEYKIESVADFLHFDSLITTHGYQDQTTGISNRFAALDGITVYLTTDLDFNKEGVATITPVGDYNKNTSEYHCYGFAGVFDGQGHTIDNVTVIPEDYVSGKTTTGQMVRGYFGLFACLAPGYGNDCGIRNLIVGDKVVFSSNNVAHTKSNEKMIGAVVGAIKGGEGGADAERGSAFMANVLNKADNVTSGLVAYTQACHLSFSNCTNEGDLKHLDNGSVIMAGKWNMGALLGCAGENGNSKFYDMSISFTNCVNKGNFTVPDDWVNNNRAYNLGSMVGLIVGSGNYANNPANGDVRTATFINCLNEGNVKQENGTTLTKQVGVYGEHAKNDQKHWNIATPINYQDRPVATTFTDKMNVKYYQLSTKTYKNTADKDCYSLRLIALHSAIDTYTDYGYDIEITYVDPTSKESVTVSTSVENLKTVNTSIKVTTLDQTNLDANVTEVKAADLDAKYQYISAVCIDNIPVAYGNLTVTVTPKLDNGTVTGAPITFVVAPNYAN